MHLLTIFSRQTWILSTLEHSQRSLDINWNRADIDAYSDYTDRQLDRLPDPSWRWPWMWNADGMCGRSYDN